VYNSHHVAEEFNKEISTITNKVMALQGKERVRITICVGNTIFDQVRRID
jgi:hypothetical protein